MRGRDRWRTFVVTTVAVVVAVGGTAWPSTAQAAVSETFGPPYRSAWLYTDTSTCTVAGTCSVTGDADAGTGVGTVTSSFTPPARQGSREQAFGAAWNKVVYRVPRGVTEVTAVFRWSVGKDAATADAGSGSGRTSASAGLAAYTYACGGDGDRCTGGSGSQALAWQSSSLAGVADTGGRSSSGEERIVTLRVTAAGALPNDLEWLAYPYALAGGDAATCVLGTCPDVTGHRTTSATITAKLLDVTVSPR